MRSGSHFIAHASDPLTSRLNGVSDAKKIAHDGTTIEGRMQKHCKAVAVDIKECGNACDTYIE